MKGRKARRPGGEGVRPSVQCSIRRKRGKVTGCGLKKRVRSLSDEDRNRLSRLGYHESDKQSNDPTRAHETLLVKGDAGICAHPCKSPLWPHWKRRTLSPDCPSRQLPSLNPREMVAAQLLHSAFCGTIILWFQSESCRDQDGQTVAVYGSGNFPDRSVGWETVGSCRNNDLANLWRSDRFAVSLPRRGCSCGRPVLFSEASGKL